MWQLFCLLLDWIWKVFSCFLFQCYKKLEFTSTLVFGHFVVVSSHVWRKIRQTNRNCQFPKFRVVMTVYFTTIFEGYHLKIKLLKKSCNFYFPAKCNNWGRSIKIHDKIVKLVHNAQKNRYIRTHLSFFLATPYLLSYPLQSFGGKFKIANFYKQLDFNMVPLKFVCKIHRHYYSNNNI